ncbi:hemogen isoform X1 [Pogona vitticeps]
MANLEKDHSYSGHLQQPTAITEEYAVPEVVITRRLRDRELLRKRKAETEEKDTHQWVLGYQKRGRQSRRGRGAGRGRGQRQVQESLPEPQPELQLEPQLELQLEPQPETVEEKPPEAPPVTSVEEKAETILDLPEEPSVPTVEPEQPCTQQLELAGAAPAGDAVFSMGLEEPSSSGEPEVPQSLENDYLTQELYGSF